MATKTPNYNLNIVPESDTTTTVQKFRTDLAGDDPNSNMMIIDRELKKLADGQGGSGGQVTLPTDLVKWKEGAPIGNPDITVTPGAPQQVFAQPEAPTEPDALIWIDTDENPTTIDLDGKISTAINAHNTDMNAHEGLSGGGSGHGGGLANFVIGTSTAGWTAADCDYLCDGTDDNVEIQDAINALPESGGRISILSGVYNISKMLEISIIVGLENANKPISIVGNVGSTILQGEGINLYGATAHYSVMLDGLTFKNNKEYVNLISILNVSTSLTNCTFIDTEVMFSHNSQTYKCDFICSNCTFICDAAFKNAAGLLDVDIGDIPFIGSYRVTNNSFTTSKTERYGTVLSVDGPCSVSDNHIVSLFAAGIRVMRGATAVGNVVKDCGISVIDSVASGNHIQNGDLVVQGSQRTSDKNISGANANGNIVNDGYITTYGNCLISGNSVSRNSDGWCIVVDKPSANAIANLSPIITSNYCSGGTGGIKLISSFSASKNVSHATITNNFCYGQSDSAIQISADWSNCLVANNVSPDKKIADLGTNNTKVNNIMPS